MNCKKDLDCYYIQIINCLKEAEAIALPLQHVRCGMQKPIWSLDPNLKTLKNKAKLWLNVWNNYGTAVIDHIVKLQLTLSIRCTVNTRITLSQCAIVAWIFLCQREIDKKLLILSWLEVICQVVIVFLHLLDMIILCLFFLMLITVCILCILVLFQPIFSTPLFQCLCIPISLLSVVEAIKKLKSDNVNNDGISRFPPFIRLHPPYWPYTSTFPDVSL